MLSNPFVPQKNTSLARKIGALPVYWSVLKMNSFSSEKPQPGYWSANARVCVPPQAIVTCIVNKQCVGVDACLADEC